MRLPPPAVAKTAALQLLLAPKLMLLRARRRQQLPAIKELRRVLIVKLDAIGDTLLLTPFLRELRRQSPRARLTLLLRKGVHEVIEGSDLADEIRPVRLGRSRLGRVAIAVAAAARTWRRRFDVAIVPRWDIDYYDAALIAALSRSRHVVGYSEKVCESKQQLDWHHDYYFSHTASCPGEIHEAVKNLRLLEEFGGIARPGPLSIQARDLTPEVEQALAGGGAGRGAAKGVALGIGASAPSRRWPAERFGQLAARLVQAGYRPVLIGAGSDRSRALRIAEICGCGNVVDLTGKLPIRASYAALGRCACFVGNDSGPMHLAAAAGIPVVEISSFPRTGDTEHFTSVTRFAPWWAEATILQPAEALPPCRDACDARRAHCILQITVDEVWNAVRAMLNRG